MASRLVFGFVGVVLFGMSSCASPPHTCADGEMNGTETDVDCGGVCAVEFIDEYPSWRCYFERALPDGSYEVTKGPAWCSSSDDCREGPFTKTGPCTWPDSCGTCRSFFPYTDPVWISEVLPASRCWGRFDFEACKAREKASLLTEHADELKKCGRGKRCNHNWDCLSYSCRGGTCIAPTCTDGSRNGQETDVDCGGVEMIPFSSADPTLTASFACPRCTHGKLCAIDDDCSSVVSPILGCRPVSEVYNPLMISGPPDFYRIERRRCVDETCGNKVKDGREKGIDCGPACLKPCQYDEDCDEDKWCISTICDPVYKKCDFF